MNYLTMAKWAGGIVGGLALAWAIYAGIIRPTTKPNPSTTQEAQTIINYNVAPKQTFGCSNIRIQRRPYENTTVVNSTAR